MSDYLAGAGPKELQVELLGGQVEGLAQHVSGVPVLKLEEPKLLFLRQNRKELSFSPIQLGLGVFSFDAIKKTWDRNSVMSISWGKFHFRHHSMNSKYVSKRCEL